MKLQDPAVEAGSLIHKANISLRKHVNGSCEDWKSMFASLCMSFICSHLLLGNQCVAHYREAKNVFRKFSSGVNLEREITAGIATGTV